MTRKEFKKLKVDDHISFKAITADSIDSVFKIIRILDNTVYYLNVYSAANAHSKTFEYHFNLHSSEHVKSFKVMSQEEVNNLYKKIVFQ